MDNIYDFYLSVAESFYVRTGLYMGFTQFYDLLVNDNLYSFVNNIVGFNGSFWRDMRRSICKSHSLKPANGLIEFLVFVKKLGLKTVVVTGRECHSIQVKLDLEKTGLIDYIDEVFTMLDLIINGGKEDFLFDKSWLIEFVCRKFGVEPREAIYIGDYRLDYESSLKAGCEFIGLTWIPERMKLLLNNGVSRLAVDFREALIHVIDMMRV